MEWASVGSRAIRMPEVKLTVVGFGRAAAGLRPTAARRAEHRRDRLLSTQCDKRSRRVLMRDAHTFSPTTAEWQGSSSSRYESSPGF
jgi:hypothetical protein